jgi:hypothetical protein
MPFQPGGPPGPGRPRREVEKRYLKSLIGAVPLKRWRAIVLKAVEDAAAGDGKARDWLSKLLVGTEPLLTLELADRVRALEERAEQGAKR